MAIRANIFVSNTGLISPLCYLYQAESELQRASLDATRTTQQLKETIDNFEKQKIRDIKVRVLTFQCDITFHLA